jgi:hypothetical protein
MRALKIYIWEDYARDYSSGMAVAVATDVRAARRAVLKTEAESYSGGSLPPATRDRLTADLKSRPRVVRLADGMPARAWTVHEGG